MVFCLLLFALSIGAFDRFSPMAEEALEVEHSLAAELGDSVVVPLGDDRVVDIQQILKRHAFTMKPTEVEEVEETEDEEVESDQSDMWLVTEDKRSELENQIKNYEELINNLEKEARAANSAPAAAAALLPTHPRDY